MVYCERPHIYDWLPRGIIQRPARIASSVSASTDTVTLDDHGLATDDEVSFRAESGGSLPSPLVASTTYYAIYVGPATFQVAAAAGGSAIDLTTTGTNVLVIAPLPWTRWIADESADVDARCPSSVTPFTTVPVVIRKYVSAMVAQRAAIACGLATPALDEALVEIRKTMDLWLKGMAIRGTNEPASAQVPQLYSGTSTESTRLIP